jgi:hypothetical protein
MKRAVIRLACAIALATCAPALAADEKADNAANGTVAGAVGGNFGGGHDGACRQMSLNLWGLSYHPDRTKGYNELNWGAGFSCYTHPDIPWLLGRGEDNRLVFEGDAMLNSWRGLMVPLSIGANWRIKTFSDGCKLYFVTAMTVAYYRHPQTGVSEVDWGPIPGVSIGCGKVRTNMMLVPSASRVPLAVAIASMSIVF